MAKYLNLFLQPKYANGVFAPRLVYDILINGEKTNNDNITNETEHAKLLDNFINNLKSVGLDDLLSACLIVSLSRISEYIESNKDLKDLVDDRKKMLEMTPEQKSELAKVFSDLILPIFLEHFEDVFKANSPDMLLLTIKVENDIIEPTGETKVFDELKVVEEGSDVPKFVISSAKRRLNTIFDRLQDGKLDVNTLSDIHALVYIPAFETDSQSEAKPLKADQEFVKILARNIRHACYHAKDKNIIKWIVENSATRNLACLTALACGDQESFLKPNDEAKFTNYKSLNLTVASEVLEQMVSLKKLEGSGILDLVSIAGSEIEAHTDVFPIKIVLRIIHENSLPPNDMAKLVYVIQKYLEKNLPILSPHVLKNKNWPRGLRRVMNKWDSAYGPSDIQKYEKEKGKKFPYKFYCVKYDKAMKGFYDMNKVEILETDQPMYDRIVEIDKEIG